MWAVTWAERNAERLESKFRCESRFAQHRLIERLGFIQHAGQRLGNFADESGKQFRGDALPPGGVA
jgi:hypothetical protein